MYKVISDVRTNGNVKNVLSSSKSMYKLQVALFSFYILYFYILYSNYLTLSYF